MSGVNKAILIGRLGKDPETRYFQDGTAVCNFTIATSNTWKDRETGEKQEKTEWHRIVAFRRLAEICGEYLTKGKQVYIEGSLQTREWEDNDGNKRWTTEVKAYSMQMLGDRSDGDGGQGQSREDQHNHGLQPTGPGGGYNEPDDDIPF